MIEKDPNLTLISFDEVLKKQMEDPQFEADFNALQEQKRLANMLKEARLKKQLTQAQVAKISGINVKNISRLERGITSPTFVTLARYAKALGGSFKFQFDTVAP